MSYSLETLEYLAERLRSISLNEIEGGELPNSGDFNLESRTDRQKKETRKILSDLCSIAREAHSQGADNVEDVLQRVDGTLNSFVRSNALAGSTYSRRRALWEHIPSFAHVADEDFVEDSASRTLPERDRRVVEGMSQIIINLFETHMDFPAQASTTNIEIARPKPWRGTLKPSSYTSLLSRFGSGASAFCDAGSLSRSIYEARCEVYSERIDPLLGFSLSSNDSCLAIPYELFSSNHTSSIILRFFLPGTGDNFWTLHHVKTELSSLDFHMTTDEERQLICLSDSAHIKLYNWETERLTHTLHSRQECTGPLAILPYGRLVRAGCGRVDVWNINSRSNACSSVQFQDSTFEPSRWTAHPSKPGTVLSAGAGGLSCVALDLEHGGKASTRYLGHGGHISSMSTDGSGDPNIFVTGCGDRYVRMYDVRNPLQFLVWDVRGRRMVYELATGNTAVRGLAWDKTRNCLYAATECEWANVPGDLDSTEEQKQEDDNPSEADARLQPPQCWPKRAHHAEDYFGHAFDAGEHRILRYQFKSNANPRILPSSGKHAVADQRGGDLDIPLLW
ncbi:WD40-repeat-containing domain protein [Armillaria borealis]|uniref:WD40-repeat-containing domain protein n=1 Tax=Armillaria borealis TaxID=47425 RepID=A0AA39IW74_9AGAR|nr:WD40-repeat-containing domain protein [Armillaria borealis]